MALFKVERRKCMNRFNFSKKNVLLSAGIFILGGIIELLSEKLAEDSLRDLINEEFDRRNGELE